jgi:hypothetical protein
MRLGVISETRWRQRLRPHVVMAAAQRANESGLGYTPVPRLLFHLLTSDGADAFSRASFLPTLVQILTDEALGGCADGGALHDHRKDDHDVRGREDDVLFRAEG